MALLHLICVEPPHEWEVVLQHLGEASLLGSRRCGRMFQGRNRKQEGEETGNKGGPKSGNCRCRLGVMHMLPTCMGERCSFLRGSEHWVLVRCFHLEVLRGGIGFTLIS